jgi:glycosyltransferase involved in cell wall biosynthesis
MSSSGTPKTPPILLRAPGPIDLEYVPPPEQREIKKGQLRIAHIPFDLTDSDSGKISAAFEQLKAQKMGFTYSLIPPEEITNPIKLYLAFNQCDLFVEQFARRSFGYLALEAMALGKTVMSGNAVALRKPWNNLDLAPVLDTNENMLMRRLESIIKEPLCLRDLCKRSRAYVENYHCADVIVAQMVEVYRRSQTRPSLFAGA